MTLDRVTILCLLLTILGLVLTATVIRQQQRIDYLDQRLDAAVTICDLRHGAP